MVGAPKVRVFFDIDGTMLLSAGAGRVALETAMEQVFGTTGQLDSYHFHGKTDPQIVIDLLGAAGLDPTMIRSRLASMWPVYLEALKGELQIRREEGSIEMLPGVPELLAVLEGREGITLGLLTGNIEPAAWLKLQAANVTTRFEVGGFGSDAEVRIDIARIAVQRIQAVDDAPSRVVVVGDTPDDIECARAVGGYSVAVATGRHGTQELAEAGADAVFADLSDTTVVLKTIMLAAEQPGDSAGAVGDAGDAGDSGN